VSARFVSGFDTEAGSGSGGAVDSVAAGDSSIVVGGTAADPTIAVDTSVIASRAYVDGLVQGAKWKASVRAATTAAVTLASDLENGDTIDGVVLATGDRILVKNQAAGAENGIYVVAASGAPARADDASTGTELVAAAVFVQAGTANADRAFICTNDAITIGVTAIVFVGMGSALGALLAANNLNDLADAATARANLAGGSASTGSGGLVRATSPTVTTPTLAGAAQLDENASVNLDAALSADGKYTGNTFDGTAGAALAFGELVYRAAADGRWELADADAVSTSGDVDLAFVVLAAAGDGDPVKLLRSGTIRADALFPALTVGAPVYASTTPGAVQVAAPSGTDDVIRRVGFAIDANTIDVQISPDHATHV
jgi:hypothetical protein